MIFIDSHGFPVDQTMDGGDSAVRAGLLALCNHTMHKQIDYRHYEKNFDGWFVRHPIQEPWNNPKNYSRDQAMCFMAGLNRLRAHELIKDFFWQRAKQFFFCQNWERDYPGTTKHLPKDFADPLFFNHIGALILGGRIRVLYVLVPFFLLVHLLMLVSHKFTGHHEENQMIAETSFYKTTWLYRRIHPKWEQVSLEYWSRRSEVEYHYMLKEFVET